MALQLLLYLRVLDHALDLPLLHQRLESRIIDDLLLPLRVLQDALKLRTLPKLPLKRLPFASTLRLRKGDQDRRGRDYDAHHQHSHRAIPQAIRASTRAPI